MYVDLDELPKGDVYRLMIQTIVPRPVAWVLSDNGNGSFNLAPFSYFTGVTSDPPLLMLSVGKKRDGARKDTWTNIESREEFVVHIADADLAPQVTATAAGLAWGESELDLVRLDTIPFEGCSLPRLADAKIAFACRRHCIVEVGHVPQGVVFGEIVRAYIADDLATVKNAEIHVDALRLNPLARLGGDDYGVLGEVRTVDRSD